MKNTFKKITASIMAVASLAISATGVVASAADVTTPVTPEIIERYDGPTGYVSFGNGATAGIYRSSTQINISTQWKSGSTVYVKLKSTSGASISGRKDKYGYDGYISLDYTGNGFTYVESYHEAGGESIELSR